MNTELTNWEFKVIDGGNPISAWLSYTQASKIIDELRTEGNLRAHLFAKLKGPINLLQL